MLSATYDVDINHEHVGDKTQEGELKKKKQQWMAAELPASAALSLCVLGTAESERCDFELQIMTRFLDINPTRTLFCCNLHVQEDDG